MLVLEEFQRAIGGDRRRVTANTQVAEFVKSLLNRAACRVILSGTPEVEDFIAREPQLSRWCGAVMPLRPLRSALPRKRSCFGRVFTSSRKPCP